MGTSVNVVLHACQTKYSVLKPNSSRSAGRDILYVPHTGFFSKA